MDLGWACFPVDPDPEAQEWDLADRAWHLAGRAWDPADQAWGKADRAWDLEDREWGKPDQGRARSLNGRDPIWPRAQGPRCLQDAKWDEAVGSDAAACRG